MTGGHPIAVLMFGTFAFVVIIGVVLFLRHMRKAENRHPMNDQRDRNIEEIRRDGPG